MKNVSQLRMDFRPNRITQKAVRWAGLWECIDKNVFSRGRYGPVAFWDGEYTSPVTQENIYFILIITTPSKKSSKLLGDLRQATLGHDKFKDTYFEDGEHDLSYAKVEWGAMEVAKITNGEISYAPSSRSKFAREAFDEVLGNIGRNSAFSVKRIAVLLGLLIILATSASVLGFI